MTWPAVGVGVGVGFALAWLWHWVGVGSVWRCLGVGSVWRWLGVGFVRVRRWFGVVFLLCFVVVVFFWGGDHHVQFGCAGHNFRRVRREFGNSKWAPRGLLTSICGFSRPTGRPHLSSNASDLGPPVGAGATWPVLLASSFCPRRFCRGLTSSAPPPFRVEGVGETKFRLRVRHVRASPHHST